MVFRFLKGLRGSGAGRTEGRRPRLDLGAVPLVYAIGDVHGQYELLMRIEARIIADARRIGQPASIVMIGDYIDRGPRSAEVVAHLMAPAPAGITRYCLCGNHEAAMLDFLADPLGRGHWLAIGGLATLSSYGIETSEVERMLGSPEQARAVAARIPHEHVAFIAGLPELIETQSAIFVHAGLRAGVGLDQQAGEDLIWIRDNYLDDYAEFGRTVVHGHTPIEVPLVTPYRIGIDTGAFFSGRLTAVRLMDGAKPKLFTT